MDHGLISFISAKAGRMLTLRVHDFIVRDAETNTGYHIRLPVHKRAETHEGSWVLSTTIIKPVI